MWSGCAAPEPFRCTPEWLLPKAVHANPWEPVGEPKIYDANTLEEYIDGAARPYLEYGLTKLIHAVYAHRADAQRQMVVDVYEMVCPLAAYGIYSAQRPEKAEEVRLGTFGYWADGELSFVKDALYVTIRSPGEGAADMAAAMLIGGYIDNRITLPAVPPAMLSVFPPEDLVARSQKYLAKDMLGHQFLGAGWLATYRYRGVNHALFLIPCKDPAEAIQRYEKLAEYIAAHGEVIRKVPQVGRAALIGTGESVGRLFVACFEENLVGTVDCFDDDRSIRLSRTLIDNLQRLKS